jgi:hypothetical protein
VPAPAAAEAAVKQLETPEDVNKRIKNVSKKLKAARELEGTHTQEPRNAGRRLSSFSLSALALYLFGEHDVQPCVDLEKLP